MSPPLPTVRGRVPAKTQTYGPARGFIVGVSRYSPGLARWLMKLQLAVREKVYGPPDNSDILPPGAQFVRYPAYYLDQPVHKQPYGWMHPGIGAQLDSAVRGFYFGDPQTIYSWFEMIYQGLHPNKILDVGCGNGKLSLQLAKLFPKAEITGIDLSPHLVRWCRKKATDMGVTNAQFYWQDAGDMIFEDNRFDIVHQGTLLHETPAYYIPSIVNEMTRVLRPGGRLSMFDWSIPETEADWAFRRRHTARGIEPFMMDYCEFNVVDYLKKIGMENVEVVARMTNQMVVVADKPKWQLGAGDWGLVLPASSPQSPAPLYIDGRFESWPSGEVFETINPATEEVLATVALAHAEDVDRAVRAARRAFDEGPWPRMRAEERARRLLKIAELLEARLDALAEVETLDTGVPITLTKGRHLPRAIANFRYFGEEAKRLMGETIPMDDAYLNIILREPIGVAGLITPWNVPLGLATMKVAAALACGNTCVLKPAEQTPLTAAALAEVAQEADLPPGVLNVIHGPGQPTGRALVAHPGVDLIAFTGGTATGRRIMEEASGGLKRLGCELGGKSANIIFADAEFERALDGALLGIFSNNGESCLAGSRLLVERPLYDRFVAAFVARAENIRLGDPLSTETEMGPLVSPAHRERVAGYVQRGLQEGGALRCGGRRPDLPTRGYYFLPTVFVNVDNRMRIAQEEIFGPVAVVIPFDGEEEAVHIANDTAYGLAGYVWSQNMNRALNTARRLRAGTVWVNTPMVRDIRAPFGGYKDSGFGRDGGRYSIEFFTETKTTCVALNSSPLPKLGVGRDE